MIGFYNYSVILTYIGLACSVFGITEAVNGNIGGALFCLMLSGVCDMFDGKIARAMKRTDDEKVFGIQIDSLCDLVCFGVLPATIGYCCGMKSYIGRVVLILYVLAAVIRLAYFNVTEQKRQETTNEVRKLYQGLPVTSSAILFPLAFALSKNHMEIFPRVYIVLMGITAVLFIADIKVAKPKTKEIITFIVVGAAILFRMLARI